MINLQTRFVYLLRRKRATQKLHQTLTKINFFSGGFKRVSTTSSPEEEIILRYFSFFNFNFACVACVCNLKWWYRNKMLKVRKFTNFNIQVLLYKMLSNVSLNAVPNMSPKRAPMLQKMIECHSSLIFMKTMQKAAHTIPETEMGNRLLNLIKT
jgi:hypothetical protein